METAIRMCIQGSLMIAAVLALRALLGRRLPKAVLPALWCAVLLRLLVPFSVGLPANFWTIATNLVEGASAAARQAAATGDAGPVSPVASAGDMQGASGTPAEAAGAPSTPDIEWVPAVIAAAWVVGAAFFLVILAYSYAKGIRRLGKQRPVDHPSAQQWLNAHRLRRRIRMRESRRVASPLTYGVFRPVIVVPVGFDWNDPRKSALVLEHEFQHVRRFDVATKGALAVASCLYWFNPLVWAMRSCAGRDIELACDEAVARRLNGHGRSLYAHALIDAAEAAGSLAPAFSGAGRGSLARRIEALAGAGRKGGLPVATVFAALLLLAFATDPLSGASSPASASDGDRFAIVLDGTAPSDAAASAEGVAESRENDATRLTTPYFSVLLPDSAGPFEYTYMEGDPAGNATGNGSFVTHQLLVRFTGAGNDSSDCFYVCCAEWPLNADGPVLWANTGIASPDGLAVAVCTPYDTGLSDLGWDAVTADATERLDAYTGYVQAVSS